MRMRRVRRLSGDVGSRGERGGGDAFDIDASAEARQRAEQKDALKRLSAENGGGGARAAKARTAKGAGRKPDARKR